MVCTFSGKSEFSVNRTEAISIRVSVLPILDNTVMNFGLGRARLDVAECGLQKTGVLLIETRNSVFFPVRQFMQYCIFGAGRI